MVDFEKELDKLLSMESEPLPQSTLEAFADAERQLLLTLMSKQYDLSLQVEEIYDLTKESDCGAMQEALREEKERSGRLVKAVLGMSDLIDDFCEYTHWSGREDLESQALLMRKNADALLEECAITRVGEQGQPLDPEIHSVQSGAASPIPKEHVASVLQSGYRYSGAVARKAAVVISLGAEEPANAEETAQEEEASYTEPAQAEAAEPPKGETVVE